MEKLISFSPDPSDMQASFPMDPPAHQQPGDNIDIPPTSVMAMTAEGGGGEADDIGVSQDFQFPPLSGQHFESS